MIRKKKHSIINLSKPTVTITETVKSKEKEATKSYDIKIFTDNEEKGIEGNYHKDLDISQIFTLAIHCIRENREIFLPILENERQYKKEKIEKFGKTFTYNKLKKKKKKLKELEEKIEKLDNAVETYTERTKDIIAEFNEIEMTETDDIISTSFRLKNNLVEKFLAVTKEYIPVKINQDLNLKSLCLCPKPPKIFNTIGEGCKVCPTCGLEVIVFDTNRASAIPKTSYDDWGNFNLVIQIYQGMHSKPMPENLEVKLDKYFSSQGLPTGEDIRALPLNDKGKKDGTNRNIMTQALQSIGYTNLVDIQLIMSNYWGYPLPNLNRHIEEIKIRYEQCKPLYYHYKGDRKSSLSAQFRLFQILYSMGFDVDPNDFKLVMTPELKREYNDIWGSVAKDLEWDWFPL